MALGFESTVVKFFVSRFLGSAWDKAAGALGSPAAAAAFEKACRTLAGRRQDLWLEYQGQALSPISGHEETELAKLLEEHRRSQRLPSVPLLRDALLQRWTEVKASLDQPAPLFSLSPEEANTLLLELAKELFNELAQLREFRDPLLASALIELTADPGQGESGRMWERLRHSVATARTCLDGGDGSAASEILGSALSHYRALSGGLVESLGTEEARLLLELYANYATLVCRRSPHGALGLVEEMVGRLPEATLTLAENLHVAHLRIRAAHSCNREGGVDAGWAAYFRLNPSMEFVRFPDKQRLLVIGNEHDAPLGFRGRLERLAFPLPPVRYVVAHYELRQLLGRPAPSGLSVSSETDRADLLQRFLRLGCTGADVQIHRAFYALVRREQAEVFKATDAAECALQEGSQPRAHRDLVLAKVALLRADLRSALTHITAAKAVLPADSFSTWLGRTASLRVPSSRRDLLDLPPRSLERFRSDVSSLLANSAPSFRPNRPRRR